MWRNVNDDKLEWCNQICVMSLHVCIYINIYVYIFICIYIYMYVRALYIRKRAPYTSHHMALRPEKIHFSRISAVCVCEYRFTFISRALYTCTKEPYIYPAIWHSALSQHLEDFSSYTYTFIYVRALYTRKRAQYTFHHMALRTVRTFWGVSLVYIHILYTRALYARKRTQYIFHQMALRTVRTF